MSCTCLDTSLKLLGFITPKFLTAQAIKSFSLPLAFMSWPPKELDLPFCILIFAGFMFPVYADTDNVASSTDSSAPKKRTEGPNKKKRR